MRQCFFAFGLVAIFSSPAFACTKTSIPGVCLDNWGGDGAKAWQGAADAAREVGSNV